VPRKKHLYKSNRCQNKVKIIITIITRLLPETSEHQQLAYAYNSERIKPSTMIIEGKRGKFHPQPLVSYLK